MTSACDAAVLLADSVDARPPAGTSVCDDAFYSALSDSLAGEDLVDHDPSLGPFAGQVVTSGSANAALERGVVAVLTAHEGHEPSKQYSALVLERLEIAAEADKRRSRYSHLSDQELLLEAQSLGVKVADIMRPHVPAPQVRARGRCDARPAARRTRTTSRASSSSGSDSDPPSDSRPHTPLLAGRCR